MIESFRARKATLEKLRKDHECGLLNSNCGHLACSFVLGLFAAYALVLLNAKVPPAFVDYPDWVYQGVLFQRVLVHHPIPGYVLKAYPVPNSLTTVGLGLLDCLFPWPWAGKIWVCIYFGASVYASYRLSRSLSVQNPSFLWLLPGTIFLNLNFWYGHINFEFGVCLFLLFAAMLFEQKDYNLGFGLVLVCLFFAHMEACACALFLLLCFCWDKGRWKLLWQALPAVLLTVWYALGRLSDRNAAESSIASSQYHYGSLDFFVFKIGTYFKTLGYVNVVSMNGFSETEAVFGKTLVLFFVLLSMVIGFAFLISFSGVAAASIQSRDSRRFAWIFIVLLFPIFALLPQSMLGTADPGARIVLVAVALGLFLTASEKDKFLRIAAACSVFLCLVNFVQFYRVEADTPTAKIEGNNLPTAILKYAHVEPETRLKYYRSLESGEMNEEIFPTGMFRKSTETKKQ